MKLYASCLILFVLTLTLTITHNAHTQSLSDEQDVLDLKVLNFNISLKPRHAGIVELKVHNTGDKVITSLTFDLVITYQPIDSKNCGLPNPLRYGLGVAELSISPNEVADIKTNISLRCMPLPFTKQIVRITRIGYSDATSWQRPKWGEVRVRAEVPNATPIKLVEPPYPLGAWVEQASGKVIVEVSLDRDGNVTSAHAIPGSSRSLTGMAESSALECKFKVEDFNGEWKELVGKIIYDFQM